MTYSNLRKISEQEAYHLGIPGYVWHVKYDKRFQHYNLKSKSFIGLLIKMIKTLCS